MLTEQYIKSIKRDIFCFDFLSNILFLFFSAIYWKRKIRSRLNDIFVVSIPFLFFLI